MGISGQVLNPVGTLPFLKHRHIPNRVSGSSEHVRETMEEVCDALTRRKGRSRGSPKGSGRCREIRGAYR